MIARKEESYINVIDVSLQSSGARNADMFSGHSLGFWILYKVEL